jgi:hypothetical protein
MEALKVLVSAGAWYWIRDQVCIKSLTEAQWQWQWRRCLMNTGNQCVLVVLM